MNRPTAACARCAPCRGLPRRKPGRVGIAIAACRVYYQAMDSAFSVDPQDARRFFERKAQARSAALDQRFDQAWAEAHSVIAMLQSDYSHLRIWQWGSLLDRTRFSEISDIDIAVEGVPDTATFFELYGKAMALTTLPLDLVELERIEPIHATSIRQRGRLVYDGI